MTRFHGSIWEVKCWRECSESPSSWWFDETPLEKIPPSCPYCNGMLRPGVVWFGENIDRRVLEEAFLATKCDVFLAIGTSSVVHPAASLIMDAKMNGAFCVEINLEQTAISQSVDLLILGKAEEILLSADELVK